VSDSYESEKVEELPGLNDKVGWSYIIWKSQNLISNLNSTISSGDNQSISQELISKLISKTTYQNLYLNHHFNCEKAEDFTFSLFFRIQNDQQANHWRLQNRYQSPWVCYILSYRIS
jgi:hypothetical protein